MNGFVAGQFRISKPETGFQQKARRPLSNCSSRPIEQMRKCSDKNTLRQHLEQLSGLRRFDRWVLVCFTPSEAPWRAFGARPRGACRPGHTGTSAPWSSSRRPRAWRGSAPQAGESNEDGRHGTHRGLGTEIQLRGRIIVTQKPFGATGKPTRVVES